MTVERPRIGITGAPQTPDAEKRYQAYFEAVEAAGGQSVPITPAGIAGRSSGEILDGLDGLVLTGGLDVAPQEYGEAPHPGMDVKPDPECDRLELPLAREAVVRDLPVLGICRGIQVLNVSLGGSLHQDIDRERTGHQTWSHDQAKSHKDAPWDAEIHEVDVSPGSRLRAIVQAGRIGVNTFHHQAIKRPAPGLVVTARAADASGEGVIEAVEAPARRFVVGVQWHPERMWKRLDAQARLFRAVVDAARRIRVG